MKRKKNFFLNFFHSFKIGTQRYDEPKKKFVKKEKNFFKILFAFQVFAIVWTRKEILLARNILLASRAFFSRGTFKVVYCTKQPFYTLGNLLQKACLWKPEFYSYWSGCKWLETKKTKKNIISFIFLSSYRFAHKLFWR